MKLRQCYLRVARFTLITALLIWASPTILAGSNAPEPKAAKAPAPVQMPWNQKTVNKKFRKHICFISLAPSPYSNRHDAMRAGFGIYLLLEKNIQDFKLPITLSYYDGIQFYEDRNQVLDTLNQADVYVLGGSTWGQGPAYYVRRFFEKGGAANLMGASATAWATAGGAHTGGEEVVHSILRSMMGMGANVFTMAQKYMVFTTDERLEPTTPGAFSKLDMWYMDQFSRMIALQALASGNRTWALQLGEILDVSPFYFLSIGGQEFPPPEETLNSYTDLLNRINAAADPESEEWQGLLALLANQ